MSSYEKHQYILNVTKAYFDALPGDDRWESIPKSNFSIPSSHVFVRDIGLIPKELAFRWLTLSHEDWNENRRPTGLCDVERHASLEFAVDPVRARSILRKQVPTFADYEQGNILTAPSGLEEGSLAMLPILVIVALTYYALQKSQKPQRSLVVGGGMKIPDPKHTSTSGRPAFIRMKRFSGSLQTI